MALIQNKKLLETINWEKVSKKIPDNVPKNRTSRFYRFLQFVRFPLEIQKFIRFFFFFLIWIFSGMSQNEKSTVKTYRFHCAWCNSSLRRRRVTIDIWTRLIYVDTLAKKMVQVLFFARFFPGQNVISPLLRMYFHMHSVLLIFWMTLFIYFFFYRFSRSQRN